jgi:hypothetical protein
MINGNFSLIFLIILLFLYLNIKIIIFQITLFNYSKFQNIIIFKKNSHFSMINGEKFGKTLYLALSIDIIKIVFLKS